jgi:hypothetical protein
MSNIGKSEAIIYCTDCGKVLGVWYNAQEKQELLFDCFCIDCHNLGCDVERKRENTNN